MTQRRLRHKIPVFVRRALVKEKVLEAYLSRPPHQQNDYIGWINRAKKEETKMKRLNQMFDGLKKGIVCMKMKDSAK